MKLLPLLLLASVALAADSIEPPKKNEDTAPLDVELLVFGLSYHTNRAMKWNEKNYGLGLGVAYNVEENVYLLASVGGYKDSFYQDARYAMVGARLMFGEREGWHTTVNGTVGYMRGSGFYRYGAMVYASVGYDWLDLCVTGIPGEDSGGGNAALSDGNEMKTPSSSMVAVFLKARVLTF